MPEQPRSSTRRRFVRGAAAAGGLLAAATVAAPVAAQDAATDAEANKALFYRIMDEVFNARDLDAAERYYEADFVQHNPQADQGIAGFRAFFGEIFAAFPDWTGTIDQAIAEGDRVVAFVDWSGTHRAPYLGIPPTGGRVTMRTADMVRIADGKVAEHWDVVDILPLLAALGVVSESEPEAAGEATPAP